MKTSMILGSAIVLLGGWQIVQAQPPGGGGGRGGGGMMANATFDAINQADADGNKDDHLTVDELRVYFAEMTAARGGGPGGGAPGGGAPGGAPGGGNQDFVATIFASWDTVPEGGDGMITEEEFNNRPQGGGGRRGGGGGGGFGGGGAPPQ